MPKVSALQSTPALASGDLVYVVADGVSSKLASLRVANVAAMVAIAAPANGMSVEVVESGRAGLFVFDTSVTAAGNNGTTFSATDATTGSWVRRYTGPVNVDWFGAAGDGITNDSAEIIAAFAAADNIQFSDKSYLMTTGVTKLASNVTVDFGSATLINNGPAFLFTFGATANTPTYAGLRISGGTFEQATPATTENRNYIKVAATEHFSIRDCHLHNVSNGGIYVEAGCASGLIEGVVVDGKSGYSTVRGIWLNGSTASDYASQLVDISTIARNATAVPVYGVSNVKVKNCSLTLAAYGIYLMNARDCHIEGNSIDVSGAGLRCLALNNYSPRAIVKNNIFKCGQSATGVLVTQFSHDVVIEGNVFTGTFGGGRDLAVAYLADALISGNRFNTDSTTQIEVDMGGAAVIRGNFFTRSAYTASTRCVRLTTINASLAGTSTYGNTATTLPGLVFTDNIVKVRNIGVLVVTTTATNGNIPGLDVVHVSGNVFYNMNTAAAGDEYPLHIEAAGTTYVVKYAFWGNAAYPEASALRSRANISGSGATAVRTEAQFASFRIANAADGGAVTSTKLWGSNFSCAASRSVNEITISPRTLAGGTGATVAVPIHVTDFLGNAYSYDIRRSSTNYVIRVFDSAGAQISLSTVAATFDVTLVEAIS